MAEARRAKRVAEGVYRMPSGSLQLRVYQGKVNGREKTVTRTLPKGTTTKEAKAIRQRMVEKAERERGGNLGNETVRDFANRWLRDYPAGRGEITMLDYEERISLFVRDFGHRKPASITRQEARLWVVGGVAPPGMKHVSEWEGVTQNEDGELVVREHRSRHKTVAAMFNNMVEDEHVRLEVNPFANLRVEQSKGRSNIMVLSDAELGRLVNIAHRLHGQTWASMITFAAWTGLRPGEIYALRWRDISFAEGVIHVRRQFRSKTNEEVSLLKTNKARREVELLPPAEDALRRIGQPTDSSQHVFIAKQGNHFTARTLTWYWAATRPTFWEGLSDDRKCLLCVQEMEADPDWSPSSRKHDQHDGIPPDFDFYELRHKFATQLAQIPGVSPMDVADQMGHADGGKLAMKTYFHVESAAARSRIRDGYAAQQQVREPVPDESEREAL